VCGVAVQSIQLTDDELWRAIANNTNALSAFIEKQSGSAESTQTINKYHREYANYIAEVRRRYPTI
jgi:hypothetical protein